MHVDIIGRTQDKTMDEILKSLCDATLSFKCDLVNRKRVKWL